ncbi:Ubiquinone biosynthesis protein UbiJ [Candidatus Erwinia haradaeae]|uniref:Ubiquinone biosynthesis protein UbiJ, partial n=1 Tax=Candidatus Erwinia haradaeae TaxID=1922217 RepID=A0A451DDG1_9GAMM|nr:hypothetical protein [Candidatus Erwinia haradaeae]VFP84518.1 Ubiquinone biosynthesis protein UbiJ [Candidatus Erwinia haradaeae]
MTKLNIEQWISIWIRDVAAQSIEQCIHYHWTLIHRSVQHNKKYLSYALTEEWNLMLGSVEFIWFTREIDTLMHALNVMENRIQNLEKL